MKLFVDDLRPPPEGWEEVKTIAKAIRLLATQNVEQVSLDHDIAFPVYKDSMTMVSLSEENYSAIAWYIAIMEESIRPKVVFIHTSNPSGREYMDWILTDKVKKIVHVYDYEHEKWKYEKENDETPK